MKRDEMVKLMAEHMWNPPKYITEIHDGGQQSIRMLDLLLTKMEEAGMLPPERPMTRAEIMGNAQLGIDIADHNTTHEWED